MAKYHNHAEIILLVVLFFRDLVKEICIDTLSEAQMNTLLFAISGVIREYCSNMVNVRYQNSTAEEELFDDLSVFLQLLSNLLDAEYEGFCITTLQ
jgi:hypothetical protein